MKTIRTIRGILRELKAIDANCAISENCLRQLCKMNAIPTRQSGSRYLIALEDVMHYFGLDEPCVNE